MLFVRNGMSFIFLSRLPFDLSQLLHDDNQIHNISGTSYVRGTISDDLYGLLIFSLASHIQADFFVHLRYTY